MEKHSIEEINKKFNRNALGRLVNNSEKVQGLPLTLEEEMNKLPLNDQIIFLTNRLEEIGTKYRAANFEFDDGPSWPGFTTGQTWNGWACPWMSKEVTISVLDWFGESNSEDYSLTYEIEDELITIIDSTCPHEPWTLEPNNDGLYYMGGVWTWSEIKGEEVCKICGQGNCDEETPDGPGHAACIIKNETEVAMENALVGFKFLKPETVLTLLKEAGLEGTCWLAYDNASAFFLTKIFELQPELEKLHKTNTLDTNPELESKWVELDSEIIETCIAIPIMRNCKLTSFYWCGECRTISMTHINCGHPDVFGINFSFLDYTEIY